MRSPFLAWPVGLLWIAGAAACNAGNAKPDDTAPDDPAPDDTAPDDTAPDDTAPDDTADATETAERCNGLDDDGDGTTADEAGLATWVGASGTLDLTPVLASGHARVPASWVPPEPGELSLCAGRWYVAIAATTDLAVRGHGEPVLSAVVGPVVSSAGAALSLTGLVFEQALAGAVVVEGGSLTATDSAFRQNAGPEGAAIAAYGAAVALSAVVFTGNEADGDGGALYVSDGDLSLDDAALEGNVAHGGSGGAVYVTETGRASPAVSIQGSTFTDNEARGTATGACDGGAVAVVGITGDAFDLQLRDLDFATNRASCAAGRGGGLYVASGVVDEASKGVAAWERLSFADGEAGAVGGALALDFATGSRHGGLRLTFTDVSSRRDTAGLGAGGLHIQTGGVFEPRRVVVTDASVGPGMAMPGAAVFLESENLATFSGTITGVAIDPAATAFDGAAVYLSANDEMIAGALTVEGLEGPALSAVWMRALLQVGIAGESRITGSPGNGLRIDGPTSHGQLLVWGVRVEGSAGDGIVLDPRGGSSIQLRDDGTSTSGAVGNAGAGVRVSSTDENLYATEFDFGEPGTPDDNAGGDLVYGPYAFTAGNDATFWCDTEGCG